MTQQLKAERIDKDHVKVDGEEYLRLRKMLIPQHRQYLEDRLLEWSNLLETTAHMLKDGKMFPDEQLVKMRKLLALMEEHRFLQNL